MKVGIIGAGSIGQRLEQRLKDAGHQVVCVVKRDQFTNRDGTMFRRPDPSLAPVFHYLGKDRPEVMFVAISTTDNGASALSYILECMREGIKVITCEKGALAWHAGELRKHLGNMGFSAACGGGTHMLGYLREQHLSACDTVRLYAVINGTLNFVLTEVARNRTLAEACAEAVKLKYAEPGSDGPLQLINGELGDVVMKLCVLYNTTLAVNEFITPRHFGPLMLSPTELKSFAVKAANYRVLATITNGATGEDGYLNGFVNTDVEGWNIRAGFMHVQQDVTYSWLPDSVSNAVRIVTEPDGGIYTLSGPGAGVGPTTTAMLNDLQRMCS